MSIYRGAHLSRPVLLRVQSTHQQLQHMALASSRARPREPTPFTFWQETLVVMKCGRCLPTGSLLVRSPSCLILLSLPYYCNGQVLNKTASSSLPSGTPIRSTTTLIRIAWTIMLLSMERFICQCCWYDTEEKSYPIASTHDCCLGGRSLPTYSRKSVYRSIQRR